MQILTILMLICSILWAIALTYFIYSIGLAILTLNVGPFITGLLIIVFATVAELAVATMNE